MSWVPLEYLVGFVAAALDYIAVPVECRAAPVCEECKSTLRWIIYVTHGSNANDGQRDCISGLI